MLGVTGQMDFVAKDCFELAYVVANSGDDVVSKGWNDEEGRF